MKTLTIGFDIDETLLPRDIAAIMPADHADSSSTILALKGFMLAIHTKAKGIIAVIKQYCLDHKITKISVLSLSARQQLNIESYKFSQRSPTSYDTLCAMVQTITENTDIPCTLDPIMIRDLANDQPIGTHMKDMQKGAYAGEKNTEVDLQLHKNPQAMCQLKCQLATLVEHRSVDKEHILLFDDLDYVTSTLSSRYQTYTVLPDMTTKAACTEEPSFICQWPQSSIKNTLKAAQSCIVEPHHPTAALSL